MKLSGYLLLLAAIAASLACVHALPAETLEPPVAESTSESASSSGWGLASLDALAQRINSWMAPVVRVIEEAVQNKTVTEVVVDARNATVQLATRVSQSEAVQGAKEVISPVTQLFDRVHDHVKDRTLQQLAGDVQRQLQQLDRSVAAFIRGLGGDRDEQAVTDAPSVTQQDPERAAAAAAAAAVADQLEQASDSDNAVEP